MPNGLIERRLARLEQGDRPAVVAHISTVQGLPGETLDDMQRRHWATTPRPPAHQPAALVWIAA